jgi:hypothetical protein
MTQETTTRKPLKRTLLFAVSALALLGTVAALGTAMNGGGLRADGLTPEVICTADRPRLTMNEVIVRASRPGPDAVARLSGINK